MKKLAALLLLVGIFTPYSCEVRPVEFLGSADWSLLFIGIPVLLAMAYALLVLAPPVARYVERRAAILCGWFRVIYFGFLGGWLVVMITDAIDPLNLGHIGMALVAAIFTLWLYFRGYRRGADPARLALFLLAIVGLPAVYEFLFEFKSLQYGAWIFSSGYALAVAAELREQVRPSSQ